MAQQLRILQSLWAMERRLANDAEAEQVEVASELAQITRLRVEKLLDA